MPGTEADDHVATARHLAHDPGDLALAVDGNDGTVPGLHDAVGERAVVDALNGRLARRVERGNDDGVSIGVWRAGRTIRAYVTDDGPGVPIEDWESVFEPFVRIEGRGRSRGSGIGLFAARRLMDAMGGRVWLEPNGYGGSRFIVALPASD